MINFLPDDSQNGIKLNLFSVYFLTKQKSYEFVYIYYVKRRHGCFAEIVNGRPDVNPAINKVKNRSKKWLSCWKTQRSM
ncbi:hypothetical protein TA05_15805 [Citrobacter rodentium]|uniref:Uncharacterized protein n=1 Tax=Citrobacter rodentium (strain ICC168) TaxID=637910 RepID=D2TPX2_CITRI|nr:hypothetical protein TA05_15805 [Citrobacter rodentium]CBG90159.1 hypothetical protein ROD_34451 [Citrobacter rodentium ICC168]